MTEPTRVLITGAGRFGALHARAWSEAGADVVALADIDAERLRAVASRLGVGQTYADTAAALEGARPDVVVIATDESVHAELALDALDAGAHVFVEKPFALSSEDAHRMIARAEQAGREIVAGHISRFAQPYATMRAAIDEDRIGRLWSMRFRRDFSRAWYEDFGGRVDPVWESCIHDIDLAVAFAGCGARRVFAARSEAAGDAAPSVVTAVAEFDNGVLATFETAWTVPGGAPQTESGALELPGAIVAEAELHGSAGIARQRLLNDALTVWNDAGAWAPNPFLWPLDGARVGGALRAEVEYALEVFRGERANDRMPMREAAWGIGIAEAITRSVATGEPVSPGRAPEAS